MPWPSGAYELGPADGSLLVKTHRDGLAKLAGHDLVIEVTEWDATLEISAESEDAVVTLTVDSRSLEVREGLHGVKPLSDRDRREIRGTIDGKVLQGEPIRFRSTRTQPRGDKLSVEGSLELAGSSHPISFELELGDDGRISASAALEQSDWGIKPYSAMMGSLRVRDRVDVEFEARV